LKINLVSLMKKKKQN